MNNQSLGKFGKLIEEYPEYSFCFVWFDY